MKNRCLNPACKPYKNYGGRGIGICSEWTNSYVAFREWAHTNGYAQGLEIDRKDNDRDYGPGNCRFVTRLENNNNKRTNVFVTAFGETKTIVEWTRDSRCSVTPQSLGQRIRKGIVPELAIAATSIAGLPR